MLSFIVVHVTVDQELGPEHSATMPEVLVLLEGTHNFHLCGLTVSPLWAA